MGPLSTKEVARQLGIGRSTLELWIKQGKVRPKNIQIGQQRYRLWTGREIERLGRVKVETYRKGRGRKKKAKK